MTRSACDDSPGTVDGRGTGSIDAPHHAVHDGVALTDRPSVPPDHVQIAYETPPPGHARTATGDDAATAAGHSPVAAVGGRTGNGDRQRSGKQSTAGLDRIQYRRRRRVARQREWQRARRQQYETETLAPVEADWGPGDGETWYERTGPADPDDDSPGADQVADGETLQDHLLWQLHLSPLSPRDRLIGVALIEAVDDDGYLRESLEGIAATLAPDIHARVR